MLKPYNSTASRKMFKRAWERVGKCFNCLLSKWQPIEVQYSRHSIKLEVYAFSTSAVVNGQKNMERIIWWQYCTPHGRTVLARKLIVFFCIWRTANNSKPYFKQGRRHTSLIEAKKTMSWGFNFLSRGTYQGDLRTTSQESVNAF